MPRKYEKKTKGNFRSGRRGSRRASMRLSMVPPGFSMFDEEYDPTTDDTMLFLQAKGADRERERFGEALGEVRDRIARIVEDYDTMLDETAYIYRDYVDELGDQASAMSGCKLRQNILRILADYKIVCEEREELLHKLNESITAQRNSLLEFDSYDEDDDFEYDEVGNYLRDYTKTIGWLSNKFRDMDAKVHLLKKRDLNTKVERKKAKQKRNIKPIDNNKDKPELTSSKEKLETWKFAADEIVDLLNTVRQESEGGKEALEFELQKIMSILSQQNDEIGKQKEMLKNEKETGIKLKQNYDKLLIQNRSLEEKLKHKRNEVTKCKQYIEEIMKQSKETKGEIVVSFEDTENDAQEELSSVMRRRFTLTESTMKGGLVELQLRDAQRKAKEIEEEKVKMEEEMTKLSGAHVLKERELSELKTSLAEKGTICPKCFEMTGTPDSKDEWNEENKQDEIDLLEEKLKENESKFESTLMELTRMKINMESAGMTLISYADIAIQTLPARKEKGKGTKQHAPPSSNMDMERTWSETMIDNQLAEDDAVIRQVSLQSEDESEPDETDIVQSTKSSVFAEQLKRDGVEETVCDEKTVSRHSSCGEDKKIDDEFAEERVDEDQNQLSDTNPRVKRNTKLVNKAIQTYCDAEEFNILRRNKESYGGENSIDSRVRLVDHIKQFIATDNERNEGNECMAQSWRTKLEQLGDDIGDLLRNSSDIEDRSRKMSSSGPQTVVKQFADQKDLFDEFHSRRISNDYTQNYSDPTKRRKKSIFVRLLESNQRKRAPSLTREQPLAPLFESSDGHIPMERVNKMDEGETSENKKIPQDSNEDNLSRTTQDILSATNLLASATNRPTTPKKELDPTSTQVPKGISDQQLVVTPSHSMVVSKQPMGTPNQSPATPGTPRSGLHAFTFPGGDAEVSEMKVQTMAYNGEDEVRAPYSKPFRLRRKSLFGHKDVLEKFSVGSEDSDIPCEKILSDNVTLLHDANERYYDSSPKEKSDPDRERSPMQFKNEKLNYSSKEASVLRQDGEKLQMRDNRSAKMGRFRPSLHPFIGMSTEDRNRLATIDAMRSGRYKTNKRADDGEEETEIEVGSLLDDLKRTNAKEDVSLRKAFLRLGLKYLKGEEDDIKPDERLTMEDQVNIIAQTAMEALKTTCDLFRRVSISEPQQLSTPPSVEENEYKDKVNTTKHGEIFPPVNSPEDRFHFKNAIEELVSEEISLPSIVKKERSPKPELTGMLMRQRMRQARNDKDYRSQEFFAKRRTSNRPFRQNNMRKNVMEKILGSRMNTFGSLMAQDNRYGSPRSFKNAAYVRRDTFGMDESDGFSLTAQSIKMPAPNLRNLSIDATGFGQTQTLLRPRPGMKKSTSQGISGAGIKYVPAITKAKSDQTNNRMLIGAGPAELSRSPLTSKLRQTVIRKTANFK